MHIMIRLVSRECSFPSRLSLSPFLCALNLSLRPLCSPSLKISMPISYQPMAVGVRHDNEGLPLSSYFASLFHRSSPCSPCTRVSFPLSDRSRTCSLPSRPSLSNLDFVLLLTSERFT